MKCRIEDNVIWFEGYAVADLRTEGIPATVAQRFEDFLDYISAKRESWMEEQRQANAKAAYEEYRAKRP